MTDRDRQTPDLLDTPIMPSGSGVADLEIARELDALESGEPLAEDGPVEAAGNGDASEIDDLSIETSGPNDAGVTASGAE